MTSDVSRQNEELARRLESCLTPEEKEIAAAAGYGKRIGWGLRPAVLVVDATYSFCGRTRKPVLESIAEQRRSCGAPAWDAVAPAAALIKQARLSGVPVIYSAMEDPQSPEYEPGLWGLKNRRGVEDTGLAPDPGKGENQIIKELAPQPGEPVFSKGKPSLFFGTGLLPYLISHRIDSLIICGGTSSGCIYATAVDGFSHNFKVAVVADACFDRIQSAHWIFLVDIDLKYGDVTTSASAIKQLKTIKMN